MTVDFRYYLNRQGVPGRQGEQGKPGFSPIITIEEDTLSSFVLAIQTEGNYILTPNLREHKEDLGGTYIRYNRETGVMYAGDADYADTGKYGVVKFASADDIARDDDSTAVTPNNVNSIISDKGLISAEDLQTYLQPGNNITFTINDGIITINGEDGGNYTEGAGIDITNKVISVEGEVLDTVETTKEVATESSLTVVGSPTINNRVVSNFSSSDYVRIPIHLSNSLASWYFQFKIKIANASTEQYFFNACPSRGLIVGIKNSKFIMYASSDGSTFDIANGQAGVTVLNNDDELDVRIGFNGTVYALDCKLTSASSWTPDIHVVNTKKIFNNGTTPTFGYVAPNGIPSEFTSAFRGSIDFNGSNFRGVGYNILWEGTDERILPTYSRYQMDKLLATKANVSDIPNSYTKSETDTLLAGKADISDIPTVGDGTITFTQGGVTKGTITTNQSGNTTIALDAGGGGGSYTAGTGIDITSNVISIAASLQQQIATMQDLINQYSYRISALENSINGGNSDLSGNVLPSANLASFSLLSGGLHLSNSENLDIVDGSISEQQGMESDSNNTNSEDR